MHYKLSFYRIIYYKIFYYRIASKNYLTNTYITIYFIIEIHCKLFYFKNVFANNIKKPTSNFLKDFFGVFFLVGE